MTWKICLHWALLKERWERKETRKKNHTKGTVDDSRWYYLSFYFSSSQITITCWRKYPETNEEPPAERPNVLFSIFLAGDLISITSRTDCKLDVDIDVDVEFVKLNDWAESWDVGVVDFELK